MFQNISILDQAEQVLSLQTFYFFFWCHIGTDSNNPSQCQGQCHWQSHHRYEDDCKDDGLVERPWSNMAEDFNSSWPWPWKVIGISQRNVEESRERQNLGCMKSTHYHGQGASLSPINKDVWLADRLINQHLIAYEWN